MPRDADIIVVGAGIIGAATARSLAGRGESVMLLEQFELGHARSSSAGTSRIFRLNYPDEQFVRLARAADSAWRELEQERGVKLIERVGSIDLGPVAAETGRALAACGVPHETLSADEVRSRWPIHLEQGETAVLQADGGFSYADRSYAAFVDAALEGGVEIRAETPVRALALERGTVRLTLDRGGLSAGAVVVTAGAWAAALLAGLDIDLPVVPTSETVAFLALPGAETLPSVIDYGRRPTDHPGIARAGWASYALAAPGEGLKAGLHHSGPVTDPDGEQEPNERIVAWVAEWVSSRFEGAGDVFATETCLYTNTADQQFVLERHGRVVVGSACSGHGYKFAPVVGRTLAALALDAVA